ncbi:hypothetical protein [Rhodopirellula baltica]|uniref:hypothetical protein n=1 Tax=Rhodopirellula baltica TaxID=265606 RepID=UPI001F264041|nr:hypothetical protein [Rhodopirellula baltica]
MHSVSETPAMKYERWRGELFELPPGSDPVMHERLESFYDVSAEIAFDYVDQMLVDPEVHICSQRINSVKASTPSIQIAAAIYRFSTRRIVVKIEESWEFATCRISIKTFSTGTALVE